MPAACPACGAAVVRETGEVAVRCPNRSCPAQLVESIKHFVSKGAMDIDGVGERLVEELFIAGLVRNVADLFRLTRDDLLGMQGFAFDKKSGEARRADRVLASIEASRQRPFARVIFALGIHHIGSVTAQALAEAFPSIDALVAARQDELAVVAGVGPVLAEAVRQYFSDDGNLETIEKLRAAGVTLAVDRPERAPGGLSGKTIVLTGKLERLTRGQAQERIESFGGRVSGTVSRGTDFVVVGADPGSKLAKATRLGVAVLDEAGFTRLLEELDRSPGGPTDGCAFKPVVNLIKTKAVAQVLRPACFIGVNISLTCSSYDVRNVRVRYFSFAG
jgi:DNA ligase (NAD+)